VTKIELNNIEGLIEDVGKAYALFEKGGSRAERLAFAMQLQVALQLLTAILRDDAAKLTPLARGYQQVMELARGTGSEMLKPEKLLNSAGSPRKPPIPLREAFERAHLAAIMHLKIEANKLAGGRGEKKNAARDVGNHFKVPWRQVDAYREHAMTENPEHDPIAWRFAILCEALAAHFPGRADQAADWLINQRLGAHLAGPIQPIGAKI
jgi:hypothetical protein